MNFFNKLAGFFNRSPTAVRYELITERANGFYSWNGQIYRSDIVRSCVRPFCRAAGKLQAKQVRQTADGIKVNPDKYIEMLLAEPNPYMTGQLLQEKLAIQLELNNNAFAYINRDDFGYATEIYPIPAVAVEAIYDKQYELFLKFTFLNGKTATYPYTDIIHLRQDFNLNDIFGESNNEAIAGMMEVITTIDQGIVKAIKNSSVIKWLMRFKQTLRPEDISSQTKAFARAYISTESDSTGVAGIDTKADVEQIKPNDYVPNSSQMDKAVQRIYNYFGVNENIIQNKFTEDDWNAYYEAKIEVFSLQISNEFTRKIFSRRERGFGNKIVFESNSLAYASMATKLNLVQFVDRGMMTPNEVREIMNLGTIEGGDKVLLRKDTGVVTKGGDNNS